MDSTNATEALWRIAETGDTHQVEPVLKDGADINASNANGTTALMRAITHGHSQTVRILLEHGADPNTSRNDKFTPLILAAFFGYLDIVKLLVEHGADTSATTRFETSATMWASARTFQNVAHYLDQPRTTRTVNNSSVEHCESQVSPISPNRPKEKISSIKASDAVNLGTPGFASATAAPKNNRVAETDGFTGSSVPIPVPQPEIEEVFPALFQETWSSPYPQLLARKFLVYSLISMVLLVALIAGFARRSSHSTVVSDQSVVPTTASQKKSEKPTATSVSDAPPVRQPDEQQGIDATKDQKREENFAGRTKSKQPFVAQRDLSGNDLPALTTEEHNVLANPDVPKSRPVDNAGPIHDRSLAAVAPATTSTAKPRPVSRVNGPKKETPPLSTVLISPSKNATTKSRTIQWP
jgi:uncharacterized protein